MKALTSVAVALLLNACSPKAPANEPEEPMVGTDSTDTDSTDTDSTDTETDEESPSQEAGSSACKGSDDCKKGLYCQKGMIGDAPAECTDSPDIMNALILCKKDSDCKSLCVAFVGSEQCGKEAGTCNCDGK